MRSQSSKLVAKKGASNKTSFKTKPVKKRTKKKVTVPKKVKALQKSAKNPKKNKDDGAENKEDDERLKEESSSSSLDNLSSKSSTARNENPSKKSKKEFKETKDTNMPKIVTKNVVSKKPTNTAKKSKPNIKAKKALKNLTDMESKNSPDVTKKIGKILKSKISPKKGNSSTAKVKNCSENILKEETINETTKRTIPTITGNDKDGSLKHTEGKEILNKTESKDKSEDKEEEGSSKGEVTSPKSTSIILSPKTPKSDVERPPKFFTSSRSPRTVDIDVKCCKNSKGNLTVSERFLPLKCETKTDDIKERTSSSAFVAQGPEIDVYTFTEKVDSPKSILSDFRNPINKTVGRVRPIARVKGTVIDKRGDPEKKKYSPHRPIEEVVKQLKASKKTEDTSTSQQQSQQSTSDLNSQSNVKDEPKPIVSKSYKMVARKSSVTGKPFSPTKFLEQDSPTIKTETDAKNVKKTPKCKKQQKKNIISDEEIDSSKFAFSTKIKHYSSSEESVSESNDDQDYKVSSGSDNPKNKKAKNKKYKRITDSLKKNTSKELKELSKDSLIDLKDTSVILGNEKPSKRRLKLLSMWSGPKKHRMASLNALAKVHCLYENESRSHVELGLMKTVERQPIPGTSKIAVSKKKEIKAKESDKQDSTSESEYENKKEKEKDSSDSSDDSPPQRTLRGVPGIRSAGKYWDPKSSTSSSEDSELESKTKSNTERKKAPAKTSTPKSDSEKPSPKMKKTAGVPIKKKRNRNEVVMDLKDMVVQKRMASLNATAILAASYEKRSPKSSKDDSTSDSCSDESFSQKPKNVIDSGVKSEVKNEEPKKEIEDTPLSDRKQKVEVIVNQDTDVTITGVYSTHHHEGFCTVSGMQYRISSTSHTQTTATANCEKEGCTRDDGARYTPLSALSSMQPPAEHTHPHPHPVPELGGLARRPGCSSAFSAPSPAAHHDPGKPSTTCNICDSMPRIPYGYYQPAGPLIKESSADAERALARYHPSPHYHAPHPPVLQQYGPYYPTDLCYGRYYRPPGPYHMAPPQPDSPMVGVGSEPYPPPQYYGTPPCYQHSPQRIPYVEYRGCPCPLNACPKNVLIGPATGKAPTGGGPVDVTSALAPPGGAFRTKVRACALDTAADTHGSGKDPPLEPEPPEPPTAADAPHPCPLPDMGGASPKRELYDVRDGLRINGDLPGPESLGPPSPARGSAGICAPQPPPIAPRRARLGKEMARRSLAGDDTTILLSPSQPPSSQHDIDDDVLAISPPICAPIDLSSSDERTTPLVDVKKENEGPTYASARKIDAQALREHNCTLNLSETMAVTDSAKPVKRRHSKPKLEIEMKDVQLDDVCKTNGIGEHVKLQKRRKVSGDQSDTPRIETVTKELKKRNSQNKKASKTPSEKKINKRKSDTIDNKPKAKKMLLETVLNNDSRAQNIAVLNEKPLQEGGACVIQKTKSAELLDNLIKKNSVERTEIKGYAPESELNPAALFLPTTENTAQTCTKKTLNINNNVVDNNSTISGVTPATIAAVSQLIEKKLANKNSCKLEKIDSKITHNLKSVLNSDTPSDSLLNFKADKKSGVLGNVEKCVDISDIDSEMCKVNPVSVNKDNCGLSKVKSESLSANKFKCENYTKTLKALKSHKCKIVTTKPDTELNNFICDSNCESQNIKMESQELKTSEKLSSSDNQITDNNEIDKIVSNCCNTSVDTNGDLKRKTVEKVVKLLVSKRQAKMDEEESSENDVDKIDIVDKMGIEKTKRCKLTTVEIKGKSVEKVAKLLVSKKTVIKTDEAASVIEDACSSPVPGLKRRAGRRRSGGRRVRRVATPVTPPELKPRPPPRWSNGWNWDGDCYFSKVYLNNDSRLDRTARCWSRMTHASGDRVARGDCVLLRASQARAQPFVARVASLWENPDDGEMMVSLVWYYRPEHTDRGRLPADAPDEVFASRHRDANSVACIEDKCYVLTFNEYCRYRKRLKAAEEGLAIGPSVVPPLPAGDAAAPADTRLPPAVSPELVLFCRKVYDFRTKKIHVPNK